VSRPHMQATLCAHDITYLVPFGIATSGVVPSTLCERFERVYGLTAFGDAALVVYGMPPNVPFQRQATATTVTAWTGTDHG
jgi:hypothetical protein